MASCERFKPLNELMYLLSFEGKQFVIATQGVVLTVSCLDDSQFFLISRPVLLQVIDQESNHSDFTPVKFTGPAAEIHQGTFYLHRPLKQITPFSKLLWQQ